MWQSHSEIERWQMWLDVMGVEHFLFYIGWFRNNRRCWSIKLGEGPGFVRWWRNFTQWLSHVIWAMNWGDNGIQIWLWRGRQVQIGVIGMRMWWSNKIDDRFVSRFHTRQSRTPIMRSSFVG